MKKILALMLMLVLVLFAVACGETVPPPSCARASPLWNGVADSLRIERKMAL